ncbi:hypothetical protein FORC46_p0101 (plasmid) [Campylobacter jejuni]|nr:hypothetical protein FORC46_p0101 [Campylobacter jejuni]
MFFASSPQPIKKAKAPKLINPPKIKCFIVISFYKILKHSILTLFYFHLRASV